MMKKFLMCFGIIAFIMLSLYGYHKYFSIRVAYVDIPKVFSGFEMKKELQGKYKKTEETRKRVLDSLVFDLQLLSKKLKSDNKNIDLKDEFDFKREDYLKRKNLTEQDNVALSNQYDKQILEQMSQYIFDYGKTNNYDLILGSDGNGTVMYANDKFNISNEIEVYINNKYKGIE